MDSLLSVTEHGGKIVFSIFLGDDYRLHAPNIYSIPNIYAVAQFTHQQFNDYWKQHPEVTVEQQGQFVGKDQYTHLVYMVEKANAGME